MRYTIKPRKQARKVPNIWRYRAEKYLRRFPAFLKERYKIKALERDLYLKMQLQYIDTDFVSQAYSKVNFILKVL
jgi:hypothetical protein